MQAPASKTGENAPDVERLYLDFDSFFASAEQHFNPALRGKPLAVLPLDTVHTACVAVSREAKARGVPGASKVVDARRILPEIIFVAARPDAYVRLHNRILEVIETCLPVSHVRSIDELVCDLLPSEAADAEGLAQRIKAALAAEFSGVLTCSIGIAKTELLAKVGAEMNKPDGFTLLQTHELPDRLAHLPLADLPGISEGMGERLARGGIENFEQLYAIGPKHARALWGSIEGERFWNALHGVHYERPETEKRMFGHSRMLPADWRTPAKVRSCARQLAMSAARRLRRTDFKTTRLAFGIRGGRRLGDKRGAAPDPKWSCDVALAPARDDRAILAALSEAIARSLREVGFAPRSISVSLHGLVEADAPQHDLFAAPSGTPSPKWEHLSDTMDTLRTRHGPNAISLGPRDDVPGGYLGAKIAFGRIPDAADFSEMQSEDADTHFCTI